MDDRVLAAWKQIADRKDDPTSPQIIKFSRTALSDLVEEIYRLRKEKEEGWVTENDG